ncbi:hypothetical protein Tdes44962_MAKER08445 [Teratosphaeria destructans]|uniref:Uncharacterized protein n=1 Tax=Teratosphaeria destructans TaxID=418781 RepID=A0A9W7SWA1_9PEZI|nr:hypothetical protein Tdes44962_MAKER08445 [Teratosphaeria destructans]
MRFHVPARGYPDLILIDFGHACFVERRRRQSLASDDSGADSEGEGPQDDDDDDDDGPFGRAVSELRRGTREGRRPEEIHAALGAFLEVAAVMRERMYEELGGEMLEFFGGGREVVTDEELAGVVPVLKE